MKQKVGTVLDARLVRRAKVYAAQRRRPLNSVIEEALAAWLDRPGAATPAGSLVARSAWSMAIDPNLLKTLLAEDLYDAA